MTEQEWDTCTDAVSMLDFLRTRAAASDRKTRLWACACCRRLLHLFPDDGRSRHVEVAELYADAKVSEEELLTAQVGWPWGFSLNPGTGCEPDDLTWVAPDRQAEVAAQANLLRDIFGRLPFRMQRFDPCCRTPLVLSLAQAAYEERVAPDPSRPVRAGWPSTRPGCWSWPTHWRRSAATTLTSSPTAGSLRCMCVAAGYWT